MNRLTENKIILVIRETRLDELIARYNTQAQAQFYVEHLGADFSDYIVEDKIYKSIVKSAEDILHKFGRVQILHRRFLPNFIFGTNDYIIVIGQDGLVANTLKYLDKQCVVAINPDPSRWDGVLLPFEVRDLNKIVPEVFGGNRRISKITMGVVELNNGQVLYAVNDFFIGAKSHTSARYSIQANGIEEDHSSSGIIVSTGLGSTGWFKSIITGAKNIMETLSNTKVQKDIIPKIPWDTKSLYFSVREPFLCKTTSSSLVFGRITDSSPLILNSKMSGDGVIFSDGIVNDFVEFNLGIKAVVKIAKKRGHLIV